MTISTWPELLTWTLNHKPNGNFNLLQKPMKAVKALTPSQKIIKKAKELAKATVQPNISTQTPGKAFSAVSPTKLKSRKIPDLSRVWII